MITSLVMGLNENCDGLLKQCLSQLKQFKGVEQYVFVDNGSTDGTIEVAESMGFEIVHNKWNHDHAAARNAGLAKVRCPWVLVTDPDELWDDWYIGGLADFLSDEANTKGVDIFSVPLHNFLGTANEIHSQWEQSNFRVMRIFRNGVRYHHAIHEMPLFNGGRLSNLDYFLYHFGWCRDSRYLEGKLQRRKVHDASVTNSLDEILSQRIPYNGKFPTIFSNESLAMKPEWTWDKYPTKG